MLKFDAIENGAEPLNDSVGRASGSTELTHNTVTGDLSFIVDDDPAICRLLANILKRIGINSRDFCDADSLIAALASHDPSLIFLDVSLAGSDAIEAIRALGERRFRGAVQLVSGRDIQVLTSVQRIGERHGLRMLPPIEKPFHPDKIRSIIQEEILSGTCQEPGQPKQPRAGSNSSRLQVQVKVTLDEVLRRRSLELFYQPKIDLRTKRLVGVEALVRGRHPDHGILLPGAFLAGAGEAILWALTEQVVAMALRDWPEFEVLGFPVKIAINMPVSSLTNLALPALIREHRPQSAAWRGLIIEVTEDEVMRDVDLAHEIATQLRLYDVELAIDDFGTGYSTLARLRHLPFAELKLDGSFVVNCASDPTNSRLCQTVIDLAHRFGCLGVAECVESASDFEALHRMGCDIGQGYYFAPPMPKDRLLSLFKERAVSKQAL